MSYDQWKTASPYDDEPDVIDECVNVAGSIDGVLKVSPNMPHSLRILFEQARDTLNTAADYIYDNI